MKQIFVLLCLILLVSFVGNANATSPMPEDVKPGTNDTVCAIHLVIIKDRERGIHEELNSTFAFEATEEKKDVLEWVTRYVNNKLNERNISEFRVGCKFPK
jgi:hypothetical protein